MQEVNAATISLPVPAHDVLTSILRRGAQQMLAGLFAAYRDDPALLPDNWRPNATDEVATLRAIGDFLAGMTDRYAIKRYEELVGPADLPEGF